MPDIVVFGAGRIAEVAKVYLDAHSADRVVGFTVDAAYQTADTFNGLPLVAWERLEERFPPGAVKLLGPLSYQRLNDFRRERHQEGKARGYAFTSFVHPASHVYTADIGENCFILENNVIQPYVRIGKGVMIWSGSHIGHHAIVGDYCFLSSHVGIGGGVKLGAGCFLAGKAGVESGLEVGDECFIGAGTVVLRNLPARSVVSTRKAATIAKFSSDRLKRMRLR